MPESTFGNTSRQAGSGVVARSGSLGSTGVGGWGGLLIVLSCARVASRLDPISLLNCVGPRSKFNHRDISPLRLHPRHMQHYVLFASASSVLTWRPPQKLTASSCSSAHASSTTQAMLVPKY